MTFNVFRRLPRDQQFSEDVTFDVFRRLLRDQQVRVGQVRDGGLGCG